MSHYATNCVFLLIIKAVMAALWMIENKIYFENPIYVI